VSEQHELSFAGLLRQLRAEAKLTQEELAEAAGLSPRSVSDLERGINRTARKDTALLLAGALSLSGPVRGLFVAAARGRAPAEEVLAARQRATAGMFAAAATRTLPRDVACFTGRQAELARLLEMLTAQAAGGGVVGVHAIGGMAGVGKTSFAVHAAHRLAGSFPDGQFFLPLNAHSPGQRPVDAADALASLLLTAGVPASLIPPGLEARSARWRDQVAGKKILLLLDDAAGHEQVRPLLPGTSGSLVLVTSRRRLAALEDINVISLDTLPAVEAAELLVRLAARPGLGVADAAVDQIARLCGYLPLAIGMLASQLRHHPARTAAELAASLAETRDRLALMHAENLSVAAAFDLSYQDPAPGPRRLFRRLGLAPGPSIDGYAAAALDGTSLDDARRHLDDLYDQHLISEPEPGRYLLHDLLREHARMLASIDDAADCDAATGRLLDYYLHAAVVASQRIVPWGTTAAGRLPPGRLTVGVPPLPTPEQAVAWLEAERANLHAAVGYAAASGRSLHANAIPSALSGFLGTYGHWDQALALHQAALSAARDAGDRPGQADALHHLGIVQYLNGDCQAAAASQQQALAIFRGAGDQAGQAYALQHLGIVQELTGDYPAAAANHRQALAIFRDTRERVGQANALNHLGRIQQLTGDYTSAASGLDQALTLYRDVGHPFGQADARNNLGVVQQVTGDYPAAAASHQQALALFRELRHRLGQAWALNDLGAVQQLTGDYPAAAASHQQALALFRDFGDRLGQAEALNRLGQLAGRTADNQQARKAYTQALSIAHDINAPLEEAHALEGIGHCHVQAGNTGKGLDCLRQALRIYQRIDVPDARRVKETLCTTA
jgi:tetratricopeptide (TPR) repeat protein/transcriptional regulator with XRE-family HTH domain